MSVVCDPLISRRLRPHQKEGVDFLWKRVTGDGGRAADPYRGCILADEMGLGKTLQCITPARTLLKQGTDGVPTMKRAIVVCPTSLVGNWEREFNKWLGRERLSAIAIKKCRLLRSNFKLFSHKPSPSSLDHQLRDIPQACEGPLWRRRGLDYMRRRSSAEIRKRVKQNRARPIEDANPAQDYPGLERPYKTTLQNSTPCFNSSIPACWGKNRLLCEGVSDAHRARS